MHVLETEEVKPWKNPRKSMVKLTQPQMKEISKVTGYNNTFPNNNQLEALAEEKNPCPAAIYKVNKHIEINLKSNVLNL